MRALAALLCLAVVACSGGQLSPAARVSAMQRALPRCDAGDGPACTEACANGGPNAACDRACKADDAAACASLASRLDHDQDADAEGRGRAIAPQDPDDVTGLFVRACTLGHGGSCVQAGGRIMNGQGRGKRSPALAVELLRAGCEKHKEAEACCAMAQLNAQLSRGTNANTITDFAAEAMHWQKLAERRGAECALDLPK